MSISVVIPNFNGFHLIEKNLPKVVQAIGKDDASIVVVDDGSKLEEREKLTEFIKNCKSDISITLLMHKKNKGFSSAVNTGAAKFDSDIYIFLNTDVVPRAGFIKNASEHFRSHSDLFGVGFMDESIENGKKVLRGRGIGKWKKGMLIHSRGEVDKTNTLWVSGGSSAINGKLFREIKGFDTLYNPFYWEDIDLSYRAQKRGFRVVFDKNILVEHRHEEGAIKKNFKQNKITTIAYRNQFIFHWKNISDGKLIVSHIFWLPYHMIGALLRRDGAFFKGFGKALLMSPRILAARGKKNVRRDEAIIQQNW